MITRRSHDEVEVAIDLLAVPLGNHRLKSGGGLLERCTCPCGVSAKFT